MFKNIKMADCKERLDIGAIYEFENKIKKTVPNVYNPKLPEDYIEWLLKYNGGHPELEDAYNLIEPIAQTHNFLGNDNASISWFYSLGLDAESSLEKHYFCKSNLFPPEFLPIGYMACGSNAICLGIGGRYQGKVYFWAIEQDWEYFQELEDKVGVFINTAYCYKHLYLISSTFTDFINKLYRSEIDIVATEKEGKPIFINYPPSSDFG